MGVARRDSSDAHTLVATRTKSVPRDSSMGCAGQRCLALSVVIGIGEAYDRLAKVLPEALAIRADKVTSRAQLVEALCNWDEDLTDNGLDIALHRLRRKLGGSGTSVRTIRGLGYLLEESADA